MVKLKGTTRWLVLCVAMLAMVLPAQAKTTLEMWQIWGVAGSELFKEALAPFEAANPDIEVDVVSSPQGVNQRSKLLTMMAAGTPPSIVFMVSPLAPMAIRGTLTPLDDLLAASRVIRPRDYPPGMLEMFQVDGVTYGIPGSEVGPDMGMVMNVDVLESAGIAGRAPGTLQELVQVDKKLTRMDSDKVTHLGFNPMAGLTNHYSAETWPALFDITLYDSASRKVNIDTPAMRSMLDYLTSFFETVPAAAVEAFHKANGGTSWGCMATGLMGMQINGYYTPGRLITTGAAENYRFAYGWVPTALNDKLQVNIGWGTVIPNGASNVAEAFRAMEYLTTPEPAKLIYERNGWLNGNLTAMRQLNVRDNPGIQWYVASLTEANRVRTPENIPVIDDLRLKLRQATWRVLRRQQSPDQALTDLQAEIQSLVDASFMK